VRGGAESGEEVAQNPAQHPAAPDRTESHEIQKALKTQGFCETMRVDAIPCSASEYPRQGSEQVHYDTGKSQGATGGGAKSGADSTAPSPADPDLARIVAAWPALPEPIRRAILALIETA
jgi:hypothetical protein